MTLLFVKCSSCAIRLVKQPKKAGTSQVVFLIELLGFPGGKEEEEERGEKKKSTKRFKPNHSNQTHEFKTFKVEWCLQYTLLALMPQGSLSNQLVSMQLK